jgi:hypothetical protein
MITNIQFLKAIFGDQYEYAHVTSFTHDPGAIAHGESGRCWAGGLFKNSQLQANANQYFTVSLFAPDESGRANRRKANFSACHVIALDDVKEKLPLEQVQRLPPPSIVLKSSLHSEQWLYLLTKPEINASRIDNLHDGLISNGLAPDGKDPGQKGATRYCRLPEGANTKAKRIAENGGIPPQCEVTEWFPERLYTLEQLAEPFGVDLDAVRRDQRVDGAADVSDHPLLSADAIHIKSVISGGRFDITCPWVDEHTDGADDGAAMFTNDDGTIGFKCHHGICEHRTGGDLLAYIEKCEPGFNARFKGWQMVREFSQIDVSLPPTAPAPVNTSPWGAILSMSVNGKSSEMKKLMLDQNFILKDLAILGQWTVFYAGPNTGKTLLTLWLLREAIISGEINGNDVIYANCDDTYKGGVEKLTIAESAGFNMLLPTENGFRSDVLLGLMRQSAEAGEAHGKVVILDTLKKFTDLMDKRLSSQFGEVARAFVSAGGSLICLAHVNKHKDSDGKSIYAGTADIRDDADCVYTIEHLGKEDGWEGRTKHTVEFQCTKSRGDVAERVAYQYTRTKGSGYQSLFDSVARVGRDVAETAKMAAELAEQQENDAETIEAIRTAIANAKHTKMEIETFVLDMTEVPRQRVRAVLDRYSGRLWIKTKGLHNKYLYSLNLAPEPREVSFM